MARDCRWLRAFAAELPRPTHKARRVSEYEARLDPSAFDGDVLRRYYEESNEIAADGVGYAMLDGIAFLRDTLAPLDSATVAVLIIGYCWRTFAAR